MPSSKPSMRRRTASQEAADAFVNAAEGSPQVQGSSSSRRPPEGTTRINANIPESLYKRFKVKSVEEGRSMTDILTGLISRYVEE